MQLRSKYKVFEFWVEMYKCDRCQGEGGHLNTACYKCKGSGIQSNVTAIKMLDFIITLYKREMKDEV